MKININLFGLNISSLWIYFAVAFGLTWLVEIAWSLSGIRLGSSSGQALLCLATSGPATAAIGLTFLTQDKAGRRDFLLRIIDIRRIRAGWYLVIFLFPPALYGLAALSDVLLGGSGATWGKTIGQLTIIPSLLTIFLTPLFEELGWRGYALDKLQSRWSALSSSLILSIVWALWHLPLSFIKGTYQYSLGFGSPEFWTFMIGFVPVTILFTWIYNNNCRSTLSAILFHCVINGTLELLTLSGLAYAYSIVLWFAAAVAVTIIWGPRRPGSSC
ncbi:MAG TPA: CPBP family intramembrane metalloprotease [Methanotrichaceae archaeon]|nr:CPBP family intramembrane metalloprotease [Methanotrichaceae archaeon]HQF17589.1 CPBP family intramembrane metalloprotease [Methanotrichaceae archaeon]HQI92156.1 CPBP family intramembrane metalloprotease [Methanotrichaceae archaeon]